MERKKVRRVPTKRRGFRALEIDGQVWFWRVIPPRFWNQNATQVKIHDPTGKSKFFPITLMSVEAETGCSCDYPGCDVDTSFVDMVTPALVKEYLTTNHPNGF